MDEFYICSDRPCNGLLILNEKSIPAIYFQTTTICPKTEKIPAYILTVKNMFNLVINYKINAESLLDIII